MSMRIRETAPRGRRSARGGRRARELQAKGSREQAYQLYEQAIALRGDSTPEWNAQMQALRRALSDEYYSSGERAYRTDVALAIKQWETSLRYDPQNLKASTRLRDARAAQEKLKGLPPAK
jgi:tetratricopeptide (TPR) repeat protein